VSTIRARGVELAWSERGAGGPVILIHDTALDGQAWEQVSAALAEAGARAIALDRRGWGGSSAPEDYRRTTIEEQSEDVAAVAEAAAAAPAVLCGAGIGAVIALDLLLRRPKLVAGAVLVEPPVLGLVPAATEALSADQVELERAVADRGPDAAVELYLSGRLLGLGPGIERLPEKLTEPARERREALLAELGAATAWRMPLRRLADATRPSLIVCSATTPPLLREASEALAERLAGTRRVELTGGTGPAHLDDPAAVARLAAGLG